MLETLFSCFQGFYNLTNLELPTDLFPKSLLRNVKVNIVVKIIIILPKSEKAEWPKAVLNAKSGKIEVDAGFVSASFIIQ